MQLEPGHLALAPGDLLVFYTDGVTQARGVNGQLFGEERLRTTVATDPDASAQQVLEAVVKEIKAFTTDTPQSDDFTLFVVKRQITSQNGQ